MAKQKLICIVGPTASGKSALAVEIARHLHGEIISADSRQVYKGLDIGTGKITKREMKGVVHHLLDVASPKKQFTAQQFLTRGEKVIADIARRGKTPIICGGSGFYIDVLLGNINLPSVAPNPQLRASLANQSPPQLFEVLKTLDPKRAETIDEHNSRRLVRAIEIAMTIGENPEPNSSSKYDVMWIGLTLTPEKLRNRIDTRLSQRLKRGMIAEAKKLHASGLSWKRMDELGLEYRSLARLLQKKITREELQSELQIAIWHYARRQMSYWKRNSKIQWFDPKKTAQIMKAIDTDSKT